MNRFFFSCTTARRLTEHSREIRLLLESSAVAKKIPDHRCSDTRQEPVVCGNETRWVVVKVHSTE